MIKAAAPARTFNGCISEARTGALAERRLQMIRKALLFAVALTASGLVVSQWQDIIRYLKIKQMSAGAGHPENVPASGTHRYSRP